MARALWLPDVLRAAGLTVKLVDGWETRGRSAFYPRGTICHATAGSRSSTTTGEIWVLLNGSTTAPPPISQLYLARNGDWHVIASGACNHALVGWAGPHKGWGNRELLGIEAANDNKGEPWPTVQYRSYHVGVGAMHRHMAWAASLAVGHKEHQPPGYGRSSSKSDPMFDMPAFRIRVKEAINPTPAPPVLEEGDEVNTLVYVRRNAPAGEPQLWALAGQAAAPGGWIETDNEKTANGWAGQFMRRETSVDLMADDWNRTRDEHRGVLTGS